MQLFSGKFYSCNDTSVPDQAACTGTFTLPGTEQVIAHCVGPPKKPSALLALSKSMRLGWPAAQVVPRVWSNADFNFDHLGNALVSLFVVATLNGYMEIMDSGE